MYRFPINYIYDICYQNSQLEILSVQEINIGIYESVFSDIDYQNISGKLKIYVPFIYICDMLSFKTVS